MTIVDATGTIHDAAGKFAGHIRGEVTDLDLGSTAEAPSSMQQLLGELELARGVIAKKAIADAVRQEYPTAFAVVVETDFDGELETLTIVNGAGEERQISRGPVHKAVSEIVESSRCGDRDFELDTADHDFAVWQADRAPAATPDAAPSRFVRSSEEDSRGWSAKMLLDQVDGEDRAIAEAWAADSDSVDAVETLYRHSAEYDSWVTAAELARFRVEPCNPSELRSGDIAIVRDPDNLYNDEDELYVIASEADEPTSPGGSKFWSVVQVGRAAEMRVNSATMWTDRAYSHSGLPIPPMRRLVRGD